jgi:hypothetical protein
MTRHHILTGFDDTGLWPVRRIKVLSQLDQKHQINDTPRYPSLLPSEKRHSTAKATMSHIKYKYGPEMSSPTRQNISELEAVVNEGALLFGASQRQNLAAKRREARLDRTMRRRIVKVPAASGYSSITHTEIDEISRTRRDLQWIEESKRQLRSMRKMEREREVPLKAKWQEARKEARDQGLQLPKWKDWVQAHNEKTGDDFIPIDENHPLWAKEAEDPVFTIDLERGPPLIRDTDFSKYARPLRDIEIQDTRSNSSDVDIYLGESPALPRTSTIPHIHETTSEPSPSPPSSPIQKSPTPGPSTLTLLPQKQGESQYQRIMQAVDEWRATGQAPLRASMPSRESRASSAAVARPAFRFNKEDSIEKLSDEEEVGLPVIRCGIV